MTNNIAENSIASRAEKFILDNQNELTNNLTTLEYNISWQKKIRKGR